MAATKYTLYTPTSSRQYNSKLESLPKNCLQRYNFTWVCIGIHKTNPRTVQSLAKFLCQTFPGPSLCKVFKSFLLLLFCQRIYHAWATSFCNVPTYSHSGLPHECFVLLLCSILKPYGRWRAYRPQDFFLCNRLLCILDSYK